MSRPFVYKVAWPTTTLWHVGGHLWAWKCPNCGGMGYMERDRVSVFNRAANHICPDTRKPFVRQLPASKTWVWVCDRCNMSRVDSTATHHSAFQAAYEHAMRGYHYANRYTTKKVTNDR